MCHNFCSNPIFYSLLSYTKNLHFMLLAVKLCNFLSAIKKKSKSVLLGSCWCAEIFRFFFVFFAHTRISKDRFVPRKRHQRTLHVLLAHYKRHIRVHVHNNNVSCVLLSFSNCVTNHEKMRENEIFVGFVDFIFSRQKPHQHLNQPQTLKKWKSLSIRTYYSTLIKEIFFGRRSWKKAQSIELI